MKIFITRIISDRGLRLLRDAGHTYTEWREKRELTAEELYAFCQEHDALLSVGPNKINEAFFVACPTIKVVSLHAVGYDNVDVNAANRHKVPIGNTPGVLSAATADTSFLLMLATSRKAFYLHHTIRKKQWGFFEPLANLGMELTGKTLGIFGLGKIGLEMARRCVGAYQMKVIYFNRHPNQIAEEELGAQLVSFDDLLAHSDVLSIHSALTPETRSIFNKAAFAKMKSTSIFVNAARGGIHDETDLFYALQSGTIWGAGLDVTNPEPMQFDNPLLDLPSVSILPHIGSATVEARSAMSEISCLNILAAFRGEELLHMVNPEMNKE